MTDLAAAYPSPPNYSSPPPTNSKLSPGSWNDRVGAMSMSPEYIGGGKSPQAGPGGYGSSSGQDKSPLSSLNLGFLKSLTDKRTTTRGKDGPEEGRGGPWWSSSADRSAGTEC